MTDTPGALEERLRGGKCPQCQGWGEVAYFGEMVGCTCLGRYEAPISMATRVEAADEIASLRARVGVLDDELTEAVEHLEAVLFSDPGPKMLASIGSARAWWMKRDAREEAQALKDMPDAE